MANDTKHREYDQEVLDDAREAHKGYVQQLLESAEEKGLNTNRLTIGAKANAAMTYRMLDPETNITLNTMVRYARVVGKKVQLRLVDADDK